MITPVFPTFSIPVAINFPISESLLAEIVATCSISALVVIGLVLFFKNVTTWSTARSIPLFKSIGFIPEATDLHPSLKIDLVKIVAVVVPNFF